MAVEDVTPSLASFRRPAKREDSTGDPEPAEKEEIAQEPGLLLPPDLTDDDVTRIRVISLRTPCKIVSNARGMSSSGTALQLERLGSYWCVVGCTKALKVAFQRGDRLLFIDGNDASELSRKQLVAMFDEAQDRDINIWLVWKPDAVINFLIGSINESLEYGVYRSKSLLMIKDPVCHQALYDHMAKLLREYDMKADSNNFDVTRLSCLSRTLKASTETCKVSQCRSKVGHLLQHGQAKNVCPNSELDFHPLCVSDPQTCDDIPLDYFFRANALIKWFQKCFDLSSQFLGILRAPHSDVLLIEVRSEGVNLPAVVDVGNVPIAESDLAYEQWTEQRESEHLNALQPPIVHYFALSVDACKWRIFRTNRESADTINLLANGNFLMGQAINLRIQGIIENMGGPTIDERSENVVDGVSSDFGSAKKPISDSRRDRNQLGKLYGGWALEPETCLFPRIEVIR